jgi:hypothetical protein
VASDECGGRQIEDQASIHLFIEVEVEVVERSLRITELCLFASSFQQSITATSEFVGHQAGDEIDGSHGFRLGLVQSGLEHGSDASQAQLSQGTIQFD